MSSNYEALPIDHAATDAVVRIGPVVQRFAKGQKYTLGTRLRGGSREAVLVRANRHAEGARGLAPKAAGHVKQRRLANLFEPISPPASGKETALCVTV